MTSSLDPALFHHRTRPTVEAFNRFIAREGHASPKWDVREDGAGIGQWVALRRRDHREGTLSPAITAALEALPGWSWEPKGTTELFNSYWHAGITALDSFVAREGHADVPRAHREDGHHLGTWVMNRRREHRRGTLSDAKRKALEAYPGWDWGVGVQEAWEMWIGALLAYVNREGHARVPRDHVEAGHQLGMWVAGVRSRRAAGALSADKVDLLDQVRGWAWNVPEARWETWMGAMSSFIEREGHALVPDDHVEDGLILGQWVMNTRRRTETITDAQRAELEALPGWSWSVLGDRWERNLAALRAYADREGHTRVPERNIEDGVNLHQWVDYCRARYHKGKLTPERIAQLEALPGWAWSVRKDPSEHALAA